MAERDELTTVYAGRHLSMVARGRWEFARRNTHKPAIGIVAITDVGNVVLVEQYRPPAGRNVVEIPAGLAGDVAGSENEDLLEAAKRELFEETGYTARQWTELGSSYSSPGLTDESIMLFLAEGVEQHGAGGGVESEDITIHEVAPGDVTQWLNDNGFAADLKLLAGLYLAQQAGRLG